MKKIKVSIIAAIGKNKELGKNNKLLWHIQEDLQRFKKLTSGHPVIMGRKTFESIGRVLPNRTNIIITRDDSYKKEGTIVVHSLDEALGYAHDKPGSDEVFIIGGGQIFKQAVEKGLVDKLYLTLVDKIFDADTFFPDYSQFRKKVYEKKGEHEQYKYRFIELEKQT